MTVNELMKEYENSPDFQRACRVLSLQEKIWRHRMKDYPKTQTGQRYERFQHFSRRKYPNHFGPMGQNLARPRPGYEPPRHLNLNQYAPNLLRKWKRPEE